jgi:hypothetical protein
LVPIVPRTVVPAAAGQSNGTSTQVGIVVAAVQAPVDGPDAISA